MSEQFTGIDSEYFSQRYRAYFVGHGELYTGDVPPFRTEDLEALLSSESITAGFHINFGQDREALADTLEALGVQNLLNQEQASVVQAVVGYEGNTHYVGKSIPDLSKLDLPSAVETLQADAWSLRLRSGSWDKFKVNGNVVSSKILIANSTQRTDEGEKIFDLKSPALVVGSVFRYMPEYSSDENDWDEPVTGLLEVVTIEDEEDELRQTGRIVGRLALRMHYNELRLRMPSANYFLEIGIPEKPSFLAVEGVRTTNKYRVARGKLVLISPEVEFEDEDVVTEERRPINYI